MKASACCPAPDLRAIGDDVADEAIATMAKALAHPIRVQIVRILARTAGCVCGDLVEQLPVAQSTVSQHLKILKDAGLIQGTIDGPRVCYCIDPEGLRRLRVLVGGLSTNRRMTIGPARAYVAEFLGTMLLLATVVGSGVMAQTLSSGNAGVALLANAIATGGILYVLILGLAPISGAHFNPVVTLIELAFRRMPRARVPGYLIAQVVGAFAGVLLAHAMFGLELVQSSQHVRSSSGELISEAVATFGLWFVIATASRSRPAAVPAAVALYIVAAYWFTASTSFANPAVTLARSFTDTFSGIRRIDVGPFIAAQIVGGAAATALTRWLLPISGVLSDSAPSSSAKET